MRTFRSPSAVSTATTCSSAVRISASVGNIWCFCGMGESGRCQRWPRRRDERASTPHEPRHRVPASRALRVPWVWGRNRSSRSGAFIPATAEI
jgi:hypothetical protein